MWIIAMLALILLTWDQTKQRCIKGSRYLNWLERTKYVRKQLKHEHERKLRRKLSEEELQQIWARAIDFTVYPY